MNFVDLLQIYSTKNNQENFFDSAVIDNRIDKTVLIDNIISKYGNATPYYTTTETIKRFSDNWFLKNKYNISQLIDTLYYEYDVFVNLDMLEEVKDVIEGDGEDKAETNRENTVSAFDSDTYTPNSNDKGTDKVNKTFKTTTTHTSHKHGDASVRSAQDVIQAQRKVVQFNIIDWVTEKYASDMFLGVY